MCMRVRRRTGEGLINLVSALTWSTDDMRMRKGTGAGLIHAHLAGVGHGAGSMTFDLQTKRGFSCPLER